MTENQKKALVIKGNHQIYLGRDLNDPMGLFVEIADLDECIPSTSNNEYYTIPDYTPDWLYEILEVFGYGKTFDEAMESVFEFSDENTIEEIKGICDVIIEL